ncbi:MAG TPA: DUF2203 domain-containing protein [Phycisphaerae bacterium]|nr:DUF2203 domain-containing protein [Phycisphaerae bacterium]
MDDKTHGLIGSLPRSKRSLPLSGKRHFTPTEANRALVLVKRIVTDLISTYPKLLDSQETCEVAERGGRHADKEIARREVIAAGESIRTCLDELEQVGVELRDWALGIVDFPCKAAGREVRLCWRWGEPAVQHWHEVEEGFALRRPIETLLAEELSLAR